MEARSKKGKAPARAATPERILEVALEVFAERGYEGTTTREVCKRAQANVAALNYHWLSKEQLWQSVCDRCRQWVMSTIASRIDFSRPIDEAFPLFLDTMFDALVQDPRPARILVWAALQAQSLDHASTAVNFQPLVDLLVGYLRQQQAAGKLSPRIELDLAVPLIYGQVLFAFVNQAGLRHAYGRDFSNAEFAERFKRAMVSSACLLLGLSATSRSESRRRPALRPSRTSRK